MRCGRLTSSWGGSRARGDWGGRARGREKEKIKEKNNDHSTCTFHNALPHTRRSSYKNKGGTRFKTKQNKTNISSTPADTTSLWQQGEGWGAGSGQGHPYKLSSPQSLHLYNFKPMHQIHQRKHLSTFYIHTYVHTYIYLYLISFSFFVRLNTIIRLVLFTWPNNVTKLKMRAERTYVVVVVVNAPLPK